MDSRTLREAVHQCFPADRIHAVGREHGVQQRVRKLDGVALVPSCTMQGTDPWVYLDDVLGKLGRHPVNRVHELTPRTWRIAREAANAGWARRSRGAGRARRCGWASGSGAGPVAQPARRGG
jgi:hypothetical protein